MLDIIREAPLGQFIRLVSQNRLLQYEEEKDGFQLPVQYSEQLTKEEKQGCEVATQSCGGILTDTCSRASDSTGNEISESGGVADVEDLVFGRTLSRIRTSLPSSDRMHAEQGLEALRVVSIPVVPEKTADGTVLVDWYTTDDAENPQNWSSVKKSFVIFILCLYTWTVYCAGPVWSTAEPDLQRHFGISPVVSALGLSLYVLAYGIGDLLFSPLTEIPNVGRNPVYYLTFFVFCVLSIPAATTDNFSGLLALRFWLGFFGSPALANGGATVGDMFSLIYIPYGLCWWVFSAWAGPAIGPVIGGFAAQAKGWRWPMWEVAWMAWPTLILLLLVMPETSSSNILLRRAHRLRKLTGDARLQSQSELDQRQITTRQMLISTLVRPTEIMLKDPSIFFINVYTGYFYGVFYTFFEVFPLVYPVFYDFDLGQTGLAFLSCLVGVIIAIILYFAYLTLYMVPDNKRNGLREQEHRLVPAIFGSCLLPVGLFMFAWTARSSIHWVVPLIGVAIFVVGHFFTMQSLFIYLPLSYPNYAASLFAGNSVWRSAIACGSVLFARPLFVNLGVHDGVTLLACLSVVGIFGTSALYIYGKKLREKSTFAQS